METGPQVIVMASRSAAKTEQRLAPAGEKIPNAETRAAMERAREMIRTGNLRFTSADEMFAALDAEKDDE